MAFIDQWLVAYEIKGLSGENSARLFVRYVCLICQQLDGDASNLLFEAKDSSSSSVSVSITLKPPYANILTNWKCSCVSLENSAGWVLGMMMVGIQTVR